LKDCTIQGLPIPDDRIGRFAEYDGGLRATDQLQAAIERDGYVLLRGVLDRDGVMAARHEVFSRLEQVGEIKSPAVEGIATGESRRRELAGDLNEFWRSVNTGSALRGVTHGKSVHEILRSILAEQARGHDLMFLRPAAVGQGTRLHYDHPFFAGRSNRILTAWIPLGDVPITDGPLVAVEGSNRFDDFLDPIREVDYAADRSNDVVQKVAYDKQNETDPITLVTARGTRLLSSGFQAGDLVVFSGFLLHGSLDNRSPIGRVRLSCDVRYQPAADPADDERYFGENPLGSSGGGYGAMKGAKPLTQPWA